jgi:hypothetical protein
VAHGLKPQLHEGAVPLLPVVRRRPAHALLDVRQAADHPRVLSHLLCSVWDHRQPALPQELLLCAPAVTDQLLKIDVVVVQLLWCRSWGVGGWWACAAVAAAAAVAAGVAAR